MSVQKCRTCLKNSTKTFPLTKPARGCSPKRTYGQLLKEYAKFECSADYELHMPQYLCFLCCRQLRNTYVFIRQAQYCNIKLISVIAKQLDCLKEQAIDLPKSDVEKSIHTKEDDIIDSALISRNTRGFAADENRKYSDSSETNILLKADLLQETIDEQSNNDIEENEIFKTESSDTSMDCATVSDNKLSSILKTIDISESESALNAIRCPMCDKLINKRNNLVKHMQTEHNIVEASIELLHKQKLASKEQILECEKCPRKYTNKYKYHNHIKNKHDNNQASNKDNNIEKRKIKSKIIKCRSCDYTAKTYSALNYHNRSKHGTEDDKFKCKFCPYMCIKKFDLLAHVKNVHKELIRILKANAEKKIEQTDILNNINNPNKHNCKTIANNFVVTQGREDNSIDKDKYSSDDDIPLAYKVAKTNLLSTEGEEDKQEFSDEEFIRNILNIKKRYPKALSTKTLARRCNECGNIYKDYKALYAHQRNVHISEDKYSLCPHCGKKYKRKTDLRIHVEKAHAPKNDIETIKQPTPKVREKRFMCTECSYVCTTITILNIHINRHHTGEKPYKCDICFKSFIVPYDLKVHRYLHTGERPYKCPICSKGFRDNSHMIKHKRIHSNERPYKCKECGKSFTQSYNLSVHKRTHLKEKKLNCPICGKLFENKSLLNIHRINENHHDEVV